MRYVLCFIMSFFILSINSSSVFAFSCSHFFGGSDSGEQFHSDLPTDSVIEVKVGAGDLPIAPLELYYLQYFEGADFNANEDKSKTEIRILSTDPIKDYIRKLILEIITDKLRDFYRVRSDYTFLVNDEKYVDEVTTQREKMRSEWGLTVSSQWEDFMKTLYEIVNSQAVQKQFGDINYENPFDIFKFSKPLAHPPEDKIVGFDKKIDELISIIFGKITEGSEIQDEIEYLRSVISEGIGKTVTRENMVKEIRITLNQYLWYISVFAHLDRVIAFQKAEAEKDAEHGSSRGMKFFNKISNTIEEAARKDVVRPLGSTGAAIIVSSNTIITTANSLKKLSWNGKVYVKKGTETIASIAYYIDPGFFQDIAQAKDGVHNNIAVVRFPEGTFDGMSQAKINIETDLTEGHLVLPVGTKKKNNEVIKMSRYTPSMEDKRFSSFVSMLKDKGALGPGSIVNVEQLLLFGTMVSRINNTFVADEYLPDSISKSKVEGAYLFGPDNRVAAVLGGAGILDHGLADFALLKDSEKFLRFITEFDKDIKIRGFNAD